MHCLGQIFGYKCIQTACVYIIINLCKHSESFCGLRRIFDHGNLLFTHSHTYRASKHSWRNPLILLSCCHFSEFVLSRLQKSLFLKAGKKNVMWCLNLKKKLVPWTDLEFFHRLIHSHLSMMELSCGCKENAKNDALYNPEQCRPHYFMSVVTNFFHVMPQYNALWVDRGTWDKEDTQRDRSGPDQFGFCQVCKLVLVFLSVTY